jgi:hypothetical protein
MIKSKAQRYLFTCVTLSKCQWLQAGGLYTHCYAANEPSAPSGLMWLESVYSVSSSVGLYSQLYRERSTTNHWQAGRHLSCTFPTSSGLSFLPKPLIGETQMPKLSSRPGATQVAKGIFQRFFAGSLCLVIQKASREQVPHQPK